MQTLHEETTLISVSELRTKLASALKQAKRSRVIIERHSKPLAVLLDPDEYKRLDDMLEDLSDVLLALEARTREQSRRPAEYIPLETARKHFLK